MLRCFDVRASQGFNYVHSQLFGQIRASNGGSDGKFHPAFYDYKSETINPAYFQQSDFRIAYAAGIGGLTLPREHKTALRAYEAHSIQRR